MFVRLAIESDFDAIIAMARINAAESRPTLTFNEQRVRAVLQRYIDKANPTFFVVEDRRDVIAFLQAGIYEFEAFDGQYTSQKVLFVRPDKRGTRASVLLMKQLVAWSEMLGVKEIVGGNDNGFNSERTARFLEHFGFTRVGFNVRRDLS